MNNIPGPITLGWPKTTKDFILTQGNTGYINFSVLALEDNQPYATYIGFTAKMSIVSISNVVLHTLTSENNDIIITHDTLTNKLKFKIIFKSADTLLLPANSELQADLKVTAPNGIEVQYPLLLKIRVAASYTR